MGLVDDVLLGYLFYWVGVVLWLEVFVVFSLFGLMLFEFVCLRMFL